MFRASIAAANPPDAVHSVPRNPREESSAIRRHRVRQHLPHNAHAFRRDKAAHKVQSLVKQSGDRQESNDCREKDQRGEKGHHKVVRERRSHLQGVIAFDIGVGTNQRRFELLELHGPLDAVRGREMPFPL